MAHTPVYPRLKARLPRQEPIDQEFRSACGKFLPELRMTLIEDLKGKVERLTGYRRPCRDRLDQLLKPSRPFACEFCDDGFVPNHPRWAFVLYRGAISRPRSLDPAGVWEALFESNRWGNTWRGQIYDYLHYHSRIHEVLGIARGSATVRIGGNKGRTLKVKAGDVMIIPAGTGHQSLKASSTFMAVGAYPPRGTYDECAPTKADHDRARKTAPKVARPPTDPVFGSRGPLLSLWKATP
jgi:uncharacterized protein YjlB